MIDPAIVEKIIDASDIIEIISEFVTLKKKGQNHVGLCPFHNENTGSFTVSQSKGIFKCFGCGKAGSLVSFIMEHEAMSFPEAIIWLGNRAGISVENTGEKPANLDQVQKFFVDKGKAQVVEYMKLRGFTAETSEFFGIGHSPVENIISNQCKDKELMLKYGVIGISNNQYFDRFRGRYTFPIHSVSGRVIGWTGRGSGTPKYLNSPQSEIFDKSKTLFNIFKAKKWIQHDENCYIVEGPTDVMRLHEKLIYNVVATNGTALTHEQCRLIKRFSDNVTLLYDGDAAGYKATNAAIPVILSEDMNIRVILLQDLDPDEYFKTSPMPASLDWMDFYVTDGDVKDPVYVSMVANETLKFIQLIPDEIKRILYVRRLSEILHIPEESLGQRITIKTDVVQKENVSALHTHEKYLTWLMIAYGGVELPMEADNGVVHVKIARVIMDDLLGDEISFTDPVLKAISDEFVSGIPDMKHFIQHDDPRIASLTANMINDNIYNKESDTETLVKDVSHSILSLKSLYVGEMKQQVQQQILQAQKDGNVSGCLKLIEKEMEYHKLYVQINHELGRVISK